MLPAVIAAAGRHYIRTASVRLPNAGRDDGRSPANCLHDLHRYGEAETLLRETWERMRKTLLDTHPDTQVCEANLAVVLRAQERVKEAEAIQLKVIAGLSQAFGNDHPSVKAVLAWELQDRNLEAQPT